MTELERHRIITGQEGLAKLIKLAFKESAIDYFAPITALWRFLRRRLKA